VVFPSNHRPSRKNIDFAFVTAVTNQTHRVVPDPNELTETLADDDRVEKIEWSIDHPDDDRSYRIYWNWPELL